MKNLISSVKMKMIIKSLAANGVVKNLHLKMEGNTLNIGEISFSEANENTKFNINFDKENGGNIDASGNQNYKIIIRDISISGNKGEEFSMETIEFDCIMEAMELFASIAK